VSAASPFDCTPCDMHSSIAGRTTSTSQCVFPAPRPLWFKQRYISFAEYLHDVSIGQEKQFVAVPAEVGFRVLLKY
jgi:hypothetical protein